jgi:hypothetical protein
MPRYSRHRPMPVIHFLRRQIRRQEQDTAKIAVKANGANGLAGGAAEPEGRLGGTRGPPERNCNSATSGRGARWFIKGPIPLEQVARAAPRGGYAVLVWFAVRVRRDSANGAPATTAWIAEATGLNVRTVRKAVAALVEAGMLKRDGDEISMPSCAKELGMPATHPYWAAVEAGLFARLPVLRKRAREHGFTLRTHGKETQPKYFALYRRASPGETVPLDERVAVIWSSSNSLREIEEYLDYLDQGGDGLVAGRLG